MDFAAAEFTDVLFFQLGCSPFIDTNLSYSQRDSQ
jgi:hypothetical protein